MRRRKPRRTSGSIGMAIVAAVVIAAVAWNAYRTPDTSAPTSASSRDGVTTTALELPPMADTARATRADSAQAAARYPEFLPAEAIETLRLIERDGPYPYRQDNGVFGNRENRLPRQSRGYYREFTVETPGSGDRGARRIIAGGRPPSEYFYTDDHYDSFRRFTLNGAALNAAAQSDTETRR